MASSCRFISLYDYCDDNGLDGDHIIEVMQPDWGLYMFCDQVQVLVSKQQLYEILGDLDVDMPQPADDDDVLVDLSSNYW